MEFLEIKPDEVVDLAACGDNPASRHQFEARQLRAINAALSASRPLLVRGEPGIGKSQLARAAAKALGRAFVQHVVDARTESRDLLWHFDAVGRLAKAQVIGALQAGYLPLPKPDEAQVVDPVEQSLKHLDKILAIRKFLHPCALWWAFDWDDAKNQAESVGAEAPQQIDGGNPAKGCVVLIDEIDKAESDVPNGLLEALGAGYFFPEGRTEPVKAKGPPPLVVITTNEERALPDAFIRRCMVLHLALPKERTALIKKLVQRGQTHFGGSVAPIVLEKAAELLADDRKKAEERHWRPLPGQAEYLDLVRAIVNQSKGDFERQDLLIAEVAEFVLKKHPDAARDLIESSE